MEEEKKLEKQEEKDDIVITENEPKKKSKKIIIISIIILSIIIILGILSTIFALLNINNTNIMNGINVNGIDISNLSKEEAIEKINKQIKESFSEGIILETEGYNETITLEEIEGTYNIDGAIETAYNIGRDGNIIINNYNILKSILLGENIKMEVSINEEKLLEKLQSINSAIPGAVKQYSYYREGKELIVTSGKTGNSIDIEKVKESIKKNIAELNEEKIKLEIEKIEPEEIDLEKIYNEIHTEAKNAYYTEDPFTIYPHVEGVDFAITKEQAKKILEERKEEYSIPLKITIPEITTDKLGTKAFPEQLSTFTTKYDASNTNRSTNLRLAASKINGTVLLPGEIFSYNKTVGERTISAGYKEAKIYSQGQVVDGLGGGICQISSTLYNAVLYANLEILSRRNHQFVTSYLPAGRDATVVYGSTDFKFKNTRTYPIKITASVSNGVAKISIYGVKEEKEYTVEIKTTTNSSIPYGTTYISDPSLPNGKVKQKGHPGYKTTTYKILKYNGAVVSRTVLSNDTYNAMQTIIVKNDSKVETPQNNNTNKVVNNTNKNTTSKPVTNNKTNNSATPTTSTNTSSNNSTTPTTNTNTETSGNTITENNNSGEEQSSNTETGNE